MKELKISERKTDDTVFMDLEGDLIYGESTLKLRREVRRLIGEGKKNISLNLEKLSYVDSSGIGEFISTLTAINREDGGHLKLLNPTDKTYHLLEISNLLTIFDISREGHVATG
jgi:anti-sigma B factor antagonist